PGGRVGGARVAGQGMLGAEPTDEGTGMLSRRGTLGGIAAAAAMMLSGCGLRGQDVSAEAQEAAAAVDGVTSAALEQELGSRFQRLLRGRIEIAESGREAGQIGRAHV